MQQDNWEDRLIVGHLNIVWCNVYTEVLTGSGTGQKGVQPDCWFLKQLCGVPSIQVFFLVVEQGNREDRPTVGHYSYFVVRRLYCGAYCKCNRATGKAD